MLHLHMCRQFFFFVSLGVTWICGLWFHNRTFWFYYGRGPIRGPVVEKSSNYLFVWWDAVCVGTEIYRNIQVNVGTQHTCSADSRELSQGLIPREMFSLDISIIYLGYFTVCFFLLISVLLEIFCQWSDGGVGACLPPQMKAMLALCCVLLCKANERNTREDTKGWNQSNQRNEMWTGRAKMWSPTTNVEQIWY
jgi:hypothetical protein